MSPGCALGLLLLNQGTVPNQRYAQSLQEPILNKICVAICGHLRTMAFSQWAQSKAMHVILNQCSACYTVNSRAGNRGLNTTWPMVCTAVPISLKNTLRQTTFLDYSKWLKVRVGNSHRSAGSRPTILEEDWELSVDFSSFFCWWFNIQAMRTYSILTEFQTLLKVTRLATTEADYGPERW